MSLSLAEVIPLFKKADPFNILNYRPVSLLSHMSKFFERISKQHCLLKMLEKWKEALDKGNFAHAIFMDLSKAFDTLNHDLLIAKLDAYRLSINSFRYIRSYLNQRLQRTGVYNSFSLWKDILAGVPQGTILGPLLLNIY